jgi:polysaccharide biosynthesis/export protein
VPLREPVYIFGAVKGPGSFDIPPHGRFTVVKAIILAGGWGQFADRSAVIILRRTPKGTERITVNVKRIIKDGRLTEDVEILPGDFVYVEEGWV